jgi:hypothetical protein
LPQFTRSGCLWEKSHPAYGNRVMMPGRGVRWTPHAIIGMLHVAEELEKVITQWSDWSNARSCSSRAAERGWSGRAKGRFGTRDGLLAGLACATLALARLCTGGIPKMGTPLCVGQWKCLTPTSDEEAAHLKCLLRTSDQRAVLTPSCSLLLPSHQPLPRNRFREEGTG